MFAWRNWAYRRRIIEDIYDRVDWDNCEELETEVGFDIITLCVGGGRFD